MYLLILFKIRPQKQHSECQLFCPNSEYLSIWYFFLQCSLGSVWSRNRSLGKPLSRKCFKSLSSCERKRASASTYPEEGMSESDFSGHGLDQWCWIYGWAEAGTPVESAGQEPFRMELCVKCIYSEPDPSYTVANLLQIQISLVTACSLISLNAMMQLVSCDLDACSTLKSCFCSRSNYFLIKSKKLVTKSVKLYLPTGHVHCSRDPLCYGLLMHKSHIHRPTVSPPLLQDDQ